MHSKKRWHGLLLLRDPAHQGRHRQENLLHSQCSCRTKTAIQCHIPALGSRDSHVNQIRGKREARAQITPTAAGADMLPETKGNASRTSQRLDVTLCSTSSTGISVGSHRANFLRYVWRGSFAGRTPRRRAGRKRTFWSCSPRVGRGSGHTRRRT